MLAVALLLAASSPSLPSPPSTATSPLPSPSPPSSALSALSALSSLPSTFDAWVEHALSLKLQVPAHEPSEKREVPLSRPGEGDSGSGSGSGSGGTDSNDTRSKKSDASFDQRMVAAGTASTPQGRTLGVGLQLGYPTALTVKYMVVADQGLIGGIGGLSPFAYSDPALSLHVDYVYHPTLLTSGEAFAVTWYIGGGGHILINNNPSQRAFFPDLPYYRSPTQLWLAARLPVGVSLAMTQLPLEIYLEANPSVLIFPAFAFGIGASIGARFYL